MNELIVPPSPNWYSNSVFVCTSDNTVIYGSRKDLIIINPNDESEVGHIKIINAAHDDRITSISPNNGTWNNPDKLVASVAEDQIVKLWDLNNYTLRDSHKGHEDNSDILVGVSLAGDRVISVSEKFSIIVWRLSTNTLVVIPNLMTGKFKVKSLATCPHAPWLTAFGLNNGLVILADLRQRGKILYKLHGNASDITSISWCPTPYNIFDANISRKICMSRKPNAEHSSIAMDFMKRDHSEELCEISLAKGNIKENAKNELDISQNSASEIEITETENDKPTECIGENSANIHIEPTNLTDKVVESTNIPIRQIDIIDKSDIKTNATIAMEPVEKPNSVQIETIQHLELAEVRNESTNPTIYKEDKSADLNTESTVNIQSVEHPDLQAIATNAMEISNKVLVTSQLDDVKLSSIQKEQLSTEKSKDIHDIDTLQNRVMKMAEIVLAETLSKAKTCDNIKDIEVEVSLQDNQKIEVSDTLQTHVVNKDYLDEYICGIKRLNDVEKIEATDLVSPTCTHDTEKVSEHFLPETTQDENNVSNIVQLKDIKTEESTNVILSIKSEDTDLKDKLKGETVDHVDNDTKSKSEDIKIPERRFICEDPTTEYLLATACKSGIICIWRAGTDGRQQLMLPTTSTRPKSSNRSKKQEDVRSRWISLCWVQPDILISSSTRNDVHAWNLIPDINSKTKLNNNALYAARSIHTDHKRNIFVIASPYYLYSYDEIFTSHNYIEDISIWTMSQDRWILCSEIGKRRELHASISTMGGYVMHLAVSPLDPTRVAVGIGDSSIRVWELSCCQPHSIKMTCLWDKIKSKVTYLDWHPVKDNCLAFATSEGQLGEFDLNIMSKAPVIYSHYHRDQIYRIQWGPLPQNKDKINGLYSCSKGEFTVHDSSKPTSDPFKILLNECRVQTFAWKTDFSVLAVGTKEGYVKLLTNDLVPFQTLYMQNKSVQCVAWHPLSTVADSGVSLYQNDLAVATNEPVIIVYRCATVEQKESDTNVIATLKGHASSIKGLSWCPHISGRLASIADDGSAMIWDVHLQTLISTFIGHGGGKQTINCVIWSPLDADLILTGGKDCTIRIWRITKNPPVPFEIEDKKKKRSPKDPNLEPSQSVLDKESTLIQDKKQSTFYALPSVSRLQNPEIGFTIQTCRKLLDQLDSAELEGNESPIEIDQCIGNASNLVNKMSMSSEKESAPNEGCGDASSSIDATQLFGFRSDIIELLNYEQKSHILKKHWELSHHLALWKGDLAQSIEEAAKAGIINPWIISMAPMVSHKLWAQLCSTYAEQLAEDGNGMLASSYFLACHKLPNAIDVLCKSNLYREAIALAHCRLSNDSTINSILEKWAQYSINVGNYEVGAQCYIKLNRLSEAGELLNKRSDKESLEMAATLAKRSNNSDLYNTIRIKLDALKPLETDGHTDLPENSGIKIYDSRFDAITNQTKVEECTESENDECANDTNA